MTIRNLTTSLALLAASSALTAQAGTPAPAAIAPAPASSPWTGSITLGYDTDYIYRGVQVYSGEVYAKDLFTATLDLNYQINDKWSWNINAWYGNSFDDDSNYDELDLYTRLMYKVSDTLSIGPSFKYYYYPVFNHTNYDEQFEPGVEAVWLPCANTTVGPVPSELLLVTSRIPAETVTPPVKVFVPLSVSRPAPLLVMFRWPPFSLMTLLIVSTFAATLICPLARNCSPSGCGGALVPRPVMA